MFSLDSYRCFHCRIRLVPTMERRRAYLRIFVLVSLLAMCFSFKDISKPGREDHERKEWKPSLKALKKISEDLSYTVYSNENRAGFQSYTLDLSEASLALEWKKTAKKSRKVRQKGEQQTTNRTTRSIFGEDTRSIVISPVQQRMFPFNTVVQVYPGCSGTVIGHSFILTAAECVHDGNNLLTTVDKMRVGLYDQDVVYNPMEGKELQNNRDVTWYKISKVFVPNSWRSRLDQDRYNYAVLRISNGHFNSCMGLEGNANLAAVSKRNRIHVGSFERFHRRGNLHLMYRFCYMERNSMMYIYEQCDASAEARGAGMYFRFWRGDQKNWERKIIAIKSDKEQAITVPGQKDNQYYGRDLRITPLVFSQICLWVSDNPNTCGKGIISDSCLRQKE